MQISERLRSIKPSLTLSVNSRALELKAQGVDVTSLAVGEPDFPTPRHICDAAKAAIDANFCRYTAVPGIPDLRKAAGRYFERNYGTPVPMESIIIGAGGKHCLYNFMQATINPGDEVLIPAPYWLSYPDMVELAGGVPVTVHAGPERNFKVTPLMLEEKTTDKTRLLVLNSPSNPTGAVYSDREFMQIMRWALARNIFVLSDEIYDQLVFPPAKMTSAITWFEHCPELVAVLNGLSKSYAMTGWRVGFLAAHPDLVKKSPPCRGTAPPASVPYPRRPPWPPWKARWSAWTKCARPSCGGAIWPWTSSRLGRGLSVPSRTGPSTSLWTCTSATATKCVIPRSSARTCWTRPMWPWCRARPSATTTASACPTRWRTMCWLTPCPGWARCWANWREKPGVEPDSPNMAEYGRVADPENPGPCGPEKNV